MKLDDIEVDARRSELLAQLVKRDGDSAIVIDSAISTFESDDKQLSEAIDEAVLNLNEAFLNYMPYPGQTAAGLMSAQRELAVTAAKLLQVIYSTGIKKDLKYDILDIADELERGAA